MKRLVVLMLAATMLCGCAQSSSAPMSTTTDGIAQAPIDSDNRYLTYDFEGYSDNVEYNEGDGVSPDEDNANAFELPVNDYTKEMDGAYGVIIVKVTEEKKPIQMSALGSAEADKAYEEAHDGRKPPVVDIGVVGAEVLYSICGDHEIGDKINITTYAKGLGLEMEVGGEYLVITAENQFPDIVSYRPIIGKEGVFNISENFTIKAQSTDSPVAVKFNDLSLADTAHEFKTIFESVKS